jgi:DNA replication protein DnaC
VDQALDAALDRLGLTGLRKVAGTLLAVAGRQGWSPGELLRVAVTVELAARDEEARRARLVSAGFEAPPVSADIATWIIAQATQAHEAKRRPPSAMVPDAVDTGLARLKLPIARRHAAELVCTAVARGWRPDEVLRTLVHMEVAARDDAARRRRLRAACLPNGSTFADYDVERSPVSPRTIAALASLEWARAACNVCVLGPPASGKTHLLVAMGAAAVDYGLRVRYVTAAELAATDVTRADVVLVDDLGAEPLDGPATAALSDLAVSESGRRAIAFASREPIRRWGRFLDSSVGVEQVTEPLLAGALAVVTARRPDATRTSRPAAEAAVSG